MVILTDGDWPEREEHEEEHGEDAKWGKREKRISRHFCFVFFSHCVALLRVKE